MEIMGHGIYQTGFLAGDDLHESDEEAKDLIGAKNKSDPRNYTKPHETEAIVRVTSCYLVDRITASIACSPLCQQECGESPPRNCLPRLTSSQNCPR